MPISSNKFPTKRVALEKCPSNPISRLKKVSGGKKKERGCTERNWWKKHCAHWPLAITLLEGTIKSGRLQYRLMHICGDYIHCSFFLSQLNSAVPAALRTDPSTHTIYCAARDSFCKSCRASLLCILFRS